MTRQIVCTCCNEFFDEGTRMYTCEICKKKICKECIPKRLKKRKVCKKCYGKG